MKDKKENKENNGGMLYMPLGMCIGISIGVAIGSAMDNIGVGMCMGLAIGVGLGSALDSLNRSSEQEDGQQNKED